MDKVIHSQLITEDANQNVDPNVYTHIIQGLEIVLQRLRDGRITADEARHEITHLDPDWKIIMQKFNESLSYEQVENLIQEEVYRLEEERRAILLGKY